MLSDIIQKGTIKNLLDVLHIWRRSYDVPPPSLTITELNIPTGIPLVYELDEGLKPTSKYYLGNLENTKAAIEAVARKGKERSKSNNVKRNLAIYS